MNLYDHLQEVVQEAISDAETEGVERPTINLYSLRRYLGELQSYKNMCDQNLSGTTMQPHPKFPDVFEEYRG